MIGILKITKDKVISVDTGYEVVYYTFASFGERMLGRFIDVLIVIIPSILIPILPAWIYWSVLLSGEKQSTIGQRVMGIKTLSLDGEYITFWQATGRFFGNILNAFFGIGILMFFFSSKNQCLHDNISDCIVVKELTRKQSK